MFRNSPELNYRAVRDMGLAAWWGGSLMGLAGLLRGATTAVNTPKERYQVREAAWSRARPFQAGAIIAYVIGTQLVRFNGRFLTGMGMPKWLTAGPENGARATATAVGIGAAVAAKRLREKEGKIYEQHSGDDEPAEAEKLRKMAHALHVLSPMASGWLLYSHLKDVMKEARRR